MWLWIGGLIMVFGTILALIPARKRRAHPHDELVLSGQPEPEPPLVEVGS